MVQERYKGLHESRDIWDNADRLKDKIAYAFGRKNEHIQGDWFAWMSFGGSINRVVEVRQSGLGKTWS